ncbi:MULTISPECIES: carbon-nitrogen hydrolase family protein [Rhodopseudomonas]|uniref:Aliphatic nitrilase n=1 Tax=Rhodopseudomonas palustris TaxID=1076 RepID=A0A0D7F7S4_RHOPL|nr:MULTISPECIES: carbon-nitrogen hydrolase family protein [Rhodopseudomonas]KIZ47752.1 aliphatic nitrilase [Rhodopseudomonas palustris]MDF3808723.1 carbon-nitrogen hydrolase family protein [Rhodopseudomonas sp. BAL398]WOK16241.1 carbon-nitrogen hydrolase family protein [Rhodopseudomonas sp. BAL398]
MLPQFKAAAIHAAPVFLDKAATTKKAVALIREAAAAGAELVAFPETFIPAFPVWAALSAPIDNHDLFVRMADQSVLVDGPEVKAIRDEAKAQGIVVSIGISEKSPASVGCIWNSNLLIGEDGAILNHHRKLVPTFYEKLIWSAGDGAGLRVVETRLGRIGQLICGENTNPLARYALMAQGEQFHISSWPPVWPTRRPSDGVNYHIAAATRIRASAHCFEAKVFGLVTAGVLDQAARDMLVAHDPSAAAVLDGTPRAATFFLDPTGEQIGEALCEDEGILYADIDLNRCVEPKQFHDVVGYYNRFDIFDLSINRRRLVPATFINDELPAAVPDDAGDDSGRAPQTARIGF